MAETLTDASATLHPRLRRLPCATVLGRRVPLARSRRSRLLGLAGIESSCAGRGLLIERCRSVHTFGMRFELDLVFLDERRRPLALHRSVPPRRIVSSRLASGVLELPVHRRPER